MDKQYLINENPGQECRLRQRRSKLSHPKLIIPRFISPYTHTHTHSQPLFLTHPLLPIPSEPYPSQPSKLTTNPPPPLQCIEGLDWTKAIHIWTKSAMVPIPEGSETYSEEPSDSDYCASQESLDQPGSLVNSGGLLEGEEEEEGVNAGVGVGVERVKGACELSGRMRF